LGVINNIYNRSIKTDTPANVLVFPYNGHFDLSLLGTGHNFHFLRDASIYTWPGFNIDKASNLSVVGTEDIDNLTLDVVMFNHRVLHKDHINQYSHTLHIPTIIVDHEPITHNNYMRNKLLESQKHTAVSCTEDIQKLHNNSHHIPYTMRSDPSFVPKDIDVLLSGSFRPEFTSVVKQILASHPMVFVGHNPTLNSAIVDTYEDYKALFHRCKVFIHMPTNNHISYELIWALQNNCWVLGLSDENTDSTFKQNPRYISCNLDDLKEQIEQVIDKTPSVGDSLYNLDYSTYINQWKNLITECKNRTFNYENVI